MRLLVLALCAWLAAALPTSYDVADNEVGTSKVFKSSGAELSSTSDEASYFYSNEGETIIEITVEEAPQYGLFCMPSKQLVDSADLIVQKTIDEKAEAAAAAAEAAVAAAASAGAGEGGVSTSAVSGGGAAASAGAGEGGAATTAVSGGGAAASAGAGEGGVATTAVSGGGAAASAGAGEGGAATTAVSGGGAAASAGAGEGGAATTSVSGGGAAASAGAGEGGVATTAVSGGGAAASAGAGEGGAATTAVSGGGAAASAGAGEGGAATTAVSGGGAAASAGAGEGGVATTAVSGGGAAASAGAGEGGAATTAVSGGGAAASAGAGEGGAATTAVSGGGAAASAGAGEGGVATTAVSGGGAAASAGAGEGGAATTAVSGGGAAAAASSGTETTSATASTSSATSSSTSAAIYLEEGPSDLEKCICVPFYLCGEEHIISDGAGAIDIRSSAAAGPTNSKCGNFDHVCCLHPRDKPLDWFVDELLAEPYRPNCGHRQPNGFGFAIEGFKDSEAQFAEFPWMAIIMKEVYTKGELAHQYLCGGSLIAKGVILTAAHCVHGHATGKLVVRLGDWNTNSVAELLPHQEFRVTHAVEHERFNKRSLFNTVALLFLDREVEFQPHIDTICLPTEYDVSLGEPFYDASKCVATGFGRERFEDKENQNIMKQVDLEEISHKSCQEKLRKTILGRWFRLHKSFTCAGGKPGVDTCRGDGGSPLVCPLLSDPHKFVQVGIVAWGIGCGAHGVPGVYASVIQLLPWIREHLAQEPGHTLEELEQTHEPVQVCITQNPLTQYQEIPIKVGVPAPPPLPIKIQYQQQQTVNY